MSKFKDLFLIVEGGHFSDREIKKENKKNNSKKNNRKKCKQKVFCSLQFPWIRPELRAEIKRSSAINIKI